MERTIINYLNPFMASPPSHCEVVIVGGGVAGCSAALHLVRAGVRNVVLIEAGFPGDGVSSGSKIPDHAYLTVNDRDEGDVFAFATKSGSAVLDDPIGTIKMMNNLYPANSETFCSHHGDIGGKRYLALANEGIAIEKGLAAQALQNPDHVRSLGSLYVAEASNVDDLRREFEHLLRLECPGVEWWSKEQVYAAAGGPTAGFEAGIYFPDDGIINSAQFCKDLLRLAVQDSRRLVGDRDALHVCTGQTVSSVDYSSDPNHAYVTLANGIRIRSSYVVLATGGLSIDPSLAGVLTPCWSYLVGIGEPPRITDCRSAAPPIPPESIPMGHPHSPNLFTWGYTHDWCMTNGFMRISGEDHYSALKPPRMQQRCESLAQWAVDKYPYLASLDGGLPEYAQRYGVYSETPDSVPIVGTPYNGARVCYLLGCNAWGQASLSYAASLVPGLLGYTALNSSQKDKLNLLTVRRFALLPIVKNGACPK